MATVIFDFDGTMVDSLEIVAEIIYTMTKQKYKLDRKDLLALRSKSVRAIAKQFQIPPWKLLFMLRRGRKMMTDYLTELEPIPGITEVINELHQQGNNLFIASTNSTYNIDLFLKNYQMRSLFNGVIGGNGLFRKSKSLLSIMNRQKNSSKPYYYIGDEVRDIEAAKDAGINSVAVTWGFSDIAQLKKAKPFALITKPEQLLDIINKPIPDN
jgi:phosphoglycolate phosphatase